MSIKELLAERKELLWINPDLQPSAPDTKIDGYGFVYIKAAQNRFIRFFSYIEKAFPECGKRRGNIESDLIAIPQVKEWFKGRGIDVKGNVFLKDDAHLPIAGSVKARGGIHEVLKYAETLAMKAGMLNPTDDYSKLASDEFKDFFGQYTIQVGSTGNLGLSIGRSAARLGFKVIVHMSSDAKEWKKELLRSEGVIVKEYDGDYSLAVEQGRKESELDEKSYFVDDENSEDLFFGYASAALRLKVQLYKAGITIDKNHPMFVYIPCGVGGAPGGITFGLKLLLGRHVHCFFAEPVEAPCVLLGMATGEGNKISVQDIGLTGQTIADGLAVGRPSGFVCKMMKNLVSGIFTVKDDRLPEYQKAVKENTGVFLEPSACAGFAGLEQLFTEGTGWDEYVKAHELEDQLENATHIVWGTGGGLMPEELR